MNVFKKDDRVRKWDGSEHTVVSTSGSIVRFRDGVASEFASDLQLVEPKFKPGDVVHNSSSETRRVIKCVKTSYGSNGGSYNGPLAYDYSDNDGWDHESTLTLVRSAPTLDEVKADMKAGRDIEAIKKYRTIYGVGLREAKDAVEAMEGNHNFGFMAVVNVPTFKVGDRVELFAELYTRDHGTVTNVDNDNNRIRARWDDGIGNNSWFNFEAVRPSTKPNLAVAIVARKEGNNFRPNDRPRVHETLYDALREAERLAKKEPCVEFAVFVLASVSIATAPVAPTVTTVLV